MALFSFTREQRLCHSFEFQSVMKEPRHRFSNDFFLFLLKPNTLEMARLGLIVSKKNVKLSVRRNWVKRQCRESFRAQQQNMKGWDLVILSKKGIGQLTASQLQHSLEGLWKKLAR